MLFNSSSHKLARKIDLNSFSKILNKLSKNMSLVLLNYASIFFIRLLFYFKAVDFTAAPYYHSLENGKRMELITPIGIDFFTILQPFPDEESRLEVTIKPFNFTVLIEFHLI